MKKKKRDIFLVLDFLLEKKSFFFLFILKKIGYFYFDFYLF